MSHARIAETYWTDPKIRRLSPEGKLLFLYFLSNPHRHYSGLYYLPIGLIPIETGLKGDTVKKELSVLSDYKILLYDNDTETIFIRKMFLYQSGGEAGLNLTDKQKIGVVNHLRSLHKTFLIDIFLKIYKGLGLKKFNPIDTPSDDDWPQSQSQSQSQYKTDLPDQGSGDSLKKTNGRDFEKELKIQFYPAYPNKKNPAGALKAYMKQGKAGKLPPIETLLSILEDQKTWPEWNRDAGKYIPYPASWLNDERWKDERSGPPIVDRKNYESRANHTVIIND